MSNDCRDQVLKSLQDNLYFCRSQLKKTKKELLIHCPNQKNKKIEPIERKIGSIITEFEMKLAKKPYCI